MVLAPLPPPPDPVLLAPLPPPDPVVLPPAALAAAALSLGSVPSGTAERFPHAARRTTSPNSKKLVFVFMLNFVFVFMLVLYENSGLVVD